MTLTKHYGTMALNEKAQTYSERKNVQFKPILEHHPLTKEEEARLRTEYYTKNNRVGYLKLYEAVRRPAGRRTPTGKPQFAPTRGWQQRCRDGFP